MHHHTLINALKASQNWINQFNHGNLDYCVASFADGASLDVKPMGQFTGQEQIHTFWQGMLQSGASDLVYKNTQVTLISDDEVQLCGQWQMNIGRGKILMEQWCRQGDGHWKLASMKLEFSEQF
ncbi:nuclear transport factor 2 family protein [Ferrimonas sp.]|uniref:nuclear transport factor 2 family protein n=1 Tax=Ferrimonas sp. TaxID=2080861 RepID=UPI003A92EF92